MAASSSTATDARPLVAHTYGEARFHTDSDILALAYAADGTLWSVEDPGVLRSWDDAGRTTARHALLDLDTNWFFSPQAKRVAAACDELLIWDTASQRQLCKMEVPSWVTAVAFHPHDGTVATGHDDGVVRLWNPDREELLAELPEHGLPVSAVAFSADGKRLASAGEDRIIKIWDVTSRKLVRDMTGHTDRIPALAWQPNGEGLVSVGWDATARLWDVNSGEPRILLNTHDDQVLALAFATDGSLLATADSASTVHLWGNLLAAQALHKLPGFAEEIRALAFRGDGSRLAVGGSDRVIHIYDPRNGKFVAGGPTEHRHAVALWAGKVVSNAGENGLRVFNEAGEEEPSPLPAGSYLHVAASSDGRWLAGSTRDSFIQLWDAQTKTLRQMDGPKASPRYLEFTPDSKILAGAVTTEGTVWLWSLETFEPSLLVIEATEGCSVEAIAWHPDCQRLLCGGVDFLSTSGATGFVCLWNVPEKKRLVSIPIGATCVTFDANAERFAFAGPDGYVNVHLTEDGEPLHEWEGADESQASALAFTPDGLQLIEAACDGILRTWDLESGDLLAVRQFRSPVEALVVKADDIVLAAHENGTISEILISRLADDE